METLQADLTGGIRHVSHWRCHHVLCPQSRKARRTPDLSQVLVGAAGSAFNSLDATAAISGLQEPNHTSLTAILAMFACLGGAFGSALAAAVWNNVLPKELRKRIPYETWYMWRDIYYDRRAQLDFPEGDPTRIAIQGSYARAQANMLNGRALVMAFALRCIIFMKDHRDSAAADDDMGIDG